MLTSLDSLEERFRMVEEASERAFDAEPIPSQSGLVHPFSAESRGRYHGRKKSVSVSRFGQSYDEQAGGSSNSLVPSPLCAVASKSTLYHTLVNPRSFESLISEGLEDEARLEDNQHVTQVERITGRQTLPKTVGAMLPRRLSRTQSQTMYVPRKRSVAISISVEKTTADTPHITTSNGGTSTAYATKPLRSRASTIDVPGARVSGGSLMERAKDFARKLRRKSRADPPNGYS
ncbi:hypothetical protein PAXRUDRAFT_29488 [Paxillus rubicundulus Ve08.2h10]|uniref:Unplaced genomic scaffold scaffold_3, whole genome shotgun sequence n=1 Tax=Paxillus rubicundulus Ve08.2h10 TaxID=930991 RepID=A0A0D0DPA5_9AGAM|nr:hypothetical protein PAXRUDRAFT_29488 [Paxillus rubicundulus Ve08.2h10]